MLCPTGHLDTTSARENSSCDRMFFDLKATLCKILLGHLALISMHTWYTAASTYSANGSRP